MINGGNSSSWLGTRRPAVPSEDTLATLVIFRNLRDSSKTTAESAIAALKKHFKPGGMEELHGLEFHRRVQGNKTVK